ncbi:unnamed protein product, partial [Scytosiphon promiscuus]
MAGWVQALRPDTFMVYPRMLRNVEPGKAVFTFLVLLALIASPSERVHHVHYDDSAVLDASLGDFEFSFCIFVGRCLCVGMLSYPAGETPAGYAHIHANGLIYLPNAKCYDALLAICTCSQ